MTETKTVEVIQADREAYVALRGIGEGGLRCNILAGMLDRDYQKDFQILARHRLASQSLSTDEEVPLYLVWSNEHAAWWGPDHRGYTRHIDRAGRYERSEALKIAGTRDGGWHVRKGNPDEIAIPEGDAVEQYAEITAALQSKDTPSHG